MVKYGNLSKWIEADTLETKVRGRTKYVMRNEEFTVNKPLENQPVNKWVQDNN